MRRFRILSILILLLAAGLAGYFKYKEVKETDWMGPVVSAPTDVLVVSIKAKNDELLEGVTASDIKDGDVTDSLVVEDISGFVDDRRIITYTAFDSDNNVGKATRQMRYTDYTRPKFDLEQPFIYSLGKDIDIFNGVTAKDCIEGNITRNIHLSKGYSIDTESLGNQKIQLEVTNSLGDTVVLPVTVTIYDPSERNQMPAITLSKYIIYIKKGKIPDYASYVSEVSYRNEEIPLESVEVDDSSVNYNKRGVYEVVYSVSSKDGYVGTMRLIVVIR